MEREGVKDNLASKNKTERRKHSEGMRMFIGLRKTERKTTIVKCNPLETTASMETLKSDDVSKVRHPSKFYLELMLGDDEGVGSKRVLKEKLDSPWKRFRGLSTYDLQAISGYPIKVVEDLQNMPLSFMQTTKIDKDLLLESEPTKTLSLHVELLEREREKMKETQPQED